MRLSMTLFVAMAIAIMISMFAGISFAAANPPLKEVNVRTFGAKGDGKTDDTAAFQKAILLTREKGGTIKVPTGSYRITKPLVLKGQTLLGSIGAAYVSDSSILPTILAESKDGPCVQLQAGGSVQGLQFMYDWKNEKPSPRPAAIEISGVGCRVSEVKIYGAWDAIMADGKNNVGRVLIEKCFIVNVHNIGIRMTGTWDSSWISKVEVWSPGSQTFPKQGIGFLLGKNDVLIMSDNFVFNANAGYKFQDSIEGCTVEGGTWGTLSNCTADFCGQGVIVDGAHTVSFVGGTYWTHHGGIVVKGKGAQVRISGAELGANSSPTLDIEGGDLVVASACQIRRVFKDYDAPALRVADVKGAAITGCVIDSSSKGTEIADGLKDVLVTNNIIRENIIPSEDGVTEKKNDD